MIASLFFAFNKEAKKELSETEELIARLEKLQSRLPPVEIDRIYEIDPQFLRPKENIFAEDQLNVKFYLN